MKKKKGFLTDIEKKDLVLLENNPKKFWKGVEKFFAYAFNNCGQISELTIPEGIKVSPRSGESLSMEVKVINLPSDWDYFDSSIFDRCIGLECINIDSANKNYCSIDGVVYNKDVTELVCCPKYIKEVNIPESVETIWAGAFRGCCNLEKIKLSSKLKSFGLASEYCFGSKGGSLSYCQKIKSIEVPEGVTYLTCGLFEGCEELEEVKLSNNLIDIGEFAFHNCLSLKSIEIPESVSGIFKGAFENCKSLTEITLPENIKGLHGYTFRNCSSLTTINLPDSLEEIGDEEFSGCSQLSEFVMPSQMRAIGEKAFAGCKNLKSITISKNTEYIGKDAFQGCENLETIYYMGIAIPFSELENTPEILRSLKFFAKGVDYSRSVEWPKDYLDYLNATERE